MKQDKSDVIAATVFYGAMTFALISMIAICGWLFVTFKNVP